MSYRRYRGMSRNRAKIVLSANSIYYHNAHDLWRARKNNLDNDVVVAAIDTVIDEIMGS